MEIDLGVRIWWSFLGGVALLNLWLWLAAVRRYRGGLKSIHSLADRRWHVVLSLVYVGVCAFRGILPRADVQRICLVDTYLSSIAVGRSVATVAELACIVQWSLIMHEYGRAAGSRLVAGLGKAVVVLIVTAELCSWYAVLSTNFLGNVIEESCWTVVAALVGVAAALLLKSDCGVELRRRLIPGLASCAAYVGFMALVDVPMYFERWRADVAAGKRWLSLAEGWQDINQRWVVTGSWSDWSSEMAWMALYFSACVWMMVSLIHAPRYSRSAPPPLPR